MLPKEASIDVWDHGTNFKPLENSSRQSQDREFWKNDKIMIFQKIIAQPIPNQMSPIWEHKTVFTFVFSISFFLSNDSWREKKIWGIRSGHALGL